MPGDSPSYMSGWAHTISLEPEMTLPKYDHARLRRQRAATGPAINLTAGEIDKTAPQINLTAPEIDRSVPRTNKTAPEIDQTAPKIGQTAPRIDIPHVPSIELREGSIFRTADRYSTRGIAVQHGRCPFRAAERCFGLVLGQDWSH